MKKTKTKLDNVSEVPTEKELSCDLSDEEVLAHSREQARLLNAKHEIEEKKKEVAAEYTLKVKTVDAEINVLTRKISTGSEQRTVKCKWIMRWDDREKDLVRLDLNEIVRTEVILDGERQQRMTFKKEEQAEAAKAPYGIWDGEKFVQDDDGNRHETTTVKVGHEIRKKLVADGAKNLMVISIAAAPLKDSIGKQTESDPGASGDAD
ncbi:hypothetical protein KAR91_61120 [Candidatus Pacearchaeota archaeon]|nr:hypothetical protein [Candidatus Pacearchaeota archaeon]